MDFGLLDNEELLRLALEAMNADRDAEAVVLLKTLLEREPTNGYAQYMLGALHAQMGLLERAEEGFRAAVAALPALTAARFQLGLLLAVKGEWAQAGEVLSPLATQPDAMGAYARGIAAAGREDVEAAVSELQWGLAMEQPIPALAVDMRGLLERLQAAQATLVADDAVEAAQSAPLATPRYLGAYKDPV